MNTIEVRGEIAAPASAVWALLGDFSGVAAWNPFVERAEIRGDGIGMTRTITARGGARIVESLEALDADEHHIRYSVQTDAGARSTADIRLEGGVPSATVVVWQSIREGEPGQEQREAIVTTLRSRIDALAQAVAAETIERAT